LDLPTGIDNPRPRYYDYHPPSVYYEHSGPVAFDFSGEAAVAYDVGAAPDYSGPGYGYLAAPPVVVEIVPRPICGVYRYWRDGVCRDRRGY
jgi:hypothetical protein